MDIFFQPRQFRISIPQRQGKKYRCSLLGRALADCLRDLIGDEKDGLGIDKSFGKEIFSVFGDVMSTYFEHEEVSSDNGSKNIASRPVHTHEHLHLVVRAVTIIVIGRIGACKPHLTKVLVRMRSHHFSCR